MLEVLLGYYVKEQLKGIFETIVYQQTVPAGSEALGATKTTKYLVDAEDGTAQKAKLDTDDYIISNVWSYCETGHVAIDIIPDADTKEKFRVDATPRDRVTPVSPPKVVEVDLQVDFVNAEYQPNNVYLILNCLRLPDEKMDEFSELSKLIPRGIDEIDDQTLKAHNDLTVVISLLQQLIALQGGTAVLPPEYAAEYLARARVCPR